MCKLILVYLRFSFCSAFRFFFNDTATTEIYTLSLHDALPICTGAPDAVSSSSQNLGSLASSFSPDRKSTRLNSSHGYISYAVFCLKKKKECRRCKKGKYNETSIHN